MSTEEEGISRTLTHCDVPGEYGNALSYRGLVVELLGLERPQRWHVLTEENRWWPTSYAHIGQALEAIDAQCGSAATPWYAQPWFAEADERGMLDRNEMLDVLRVTHRVEKLATALDEAVESGKVDTAAVAERVLGADDVWQGSKEGAAIGAEERAEQERMKKVRDVHAAAEDRLREKLKAIRRGDPIIGGAASDHIMQFFNYSHLPEGPVQECGRMFCKLADQVVDNVPRNPERTVALRKLLEAKDAAVRALIAKEDRPWEALAGAGEKKT